MSATDPTGARRLATETKQAFRTTEFWVYVVILLALLIAGAVTGADDRALGPDAGDSLDAGHTWLYAVILTSAYLLSRGIAKAGSQASYRDSLDLNAGEGLGDRVKAAAAVLREGEGATARRDPPTRVNP